MAESAEVYVDAGCVWIGDPCYVIGSDSAAASRQGVHTVGDFGARLERGKDIQSPLGKGMGVCVSSGHGDGTYKVEIERDKESGRVASAKITFIKAAVM